MLHITDDVSLGATIKPVSIKASVDYDLLQSLILMAEFDRVEKLEDLTDEILSTWLENMDTTRKLEFFKQ